MRHASLAILLAACWKNAPEPPPPRPPEGPPHVELIAAAGSTIQFLASRNGGIGITGTADAPAAIHSLEWLDREVAVLSHHDESGIPFVGLATSKAGYRALKLPLDKALWPDLQKPDLDKYDPPNWSITTTAANELWLGRCEWGHFADGGECTEWAYARLLPTAAPPTTTKPEQRTARYKLVTAAPPAGIRVEILDDPEPHMIDSGEYETPQKILRCTQDGNVTELPPPDERRASYGFLGMSDVEWLQTDPPLFRVTRSEMCMDVCTTHILFEGCTQSKRYEGARIVPGPDGVFALVTDDRVSVRWRGKGIGAFREHAMHVSFAPPRPAP